MRKKIVNGLVKCWSFFTRGISDTKWKQDLRVWIFQRRPFLHKEFLVNQGDVAILVGSPRPYIVEDTIKIAGKKGKVILIEADPTNVETHQAYFAPKSYPQLSIVGKAMSDSEGRATFLRAPDPLDHKLLIEGIDMDNDYLADDYYIEQIEVPISTVSIVAAEHQIDHIDYIEITVNGAELLVLKGMEDLLANTQRIFAKAHAINEETGEPLNKEIAPFLEQRGFNTLITLPTRSSAKTKDWGMRQGDVYAWRPAT